MQPTSAKPGWFALSAQPAGEQPRVSPAAFGTFMCLLVLSPLMRGGNRHVALVLLEAAAIAFIAMVVTSGVLNEGRSRRHWLLGLVLLSPAWLALVYLLPLPSSLSGAGAGRSLYAELLASAGIHAADWRPLSLVPDATLVSLLSGVLLVAAVLAGYHMSAEQIRKSFIVLIAVAFAQVLFGLLQASGGKESSLYFGGLGGRPFGTFANPNHFANYLAMALVAYILLAFQALVKRRNWRDHGGGSSRAGAVVVWSGGAVFLLVGILMSRSRAATLIALAAGSAAFVLALAFASRSRRKSWRSKVAVALIAVLAGIALVGADVLLTRFDLDRLQLDLPSRAVQVATTLEGAAQFWPWGAGWGTYYSVYPRFQPANLVGIADYAHNDYAQMLFEAGIFAILLMAACGYLLAHRGIELVRIAVKERRLNGEQMMSAVCGIGLLGFLLHSFAEFNMHIPANAIVAALLAGVFLRPLDRETSGTHSEPAPHD